MKPFLSVLIFVLITFQGFAQNKPIILGKIDTITSKILGETRKVWVYVPDNDPDHIYEPSRYPVVYLLDGDAHFYSVVGIIQQLSSVNGNSLMPGMIVVGITNTDRMRDLTPTHIAFDPVTGDSNFVRNTGGGDKFISFMEKELIPYIESNYPTLPYRTLIGHSLGGLMAIHTLVNHQHLFNSYISIDPSMWWDQRKLLKTAEKQLQGDMKGKTLFLAIANTMDQGYDTTSVIKDTSIETDHIRSILDFNKLMQKSKLNGLSYQYKYYHDDTHGSVPLVATHDGLRAVFRFYDFRLNNEDFMNFSKKTIEKVESHFDKVSRHFGFPYKIPENMTNQLGYMAMSLNKLEEAEYLFSLNVRNYPGSFNVYDSMGDYYHSKGDKAKAIENYKKALAIKDWDVTKNKLKDLEK